MQWLRHRPEIRSNAGRKTRRDTQRVTQFQAGELHELRGRGAGAERPHCPAGMVTAPIMLAGHQLGNFAFDLEADVKRRCERASIDAAQLLRHDNGRGKRRNRRMSQQAINVTRIARDLGVIPVMRVSGRPEDAAAMLAGTRDLPAPSRSASGFPA